MNKIAKFEKVSAEEFQAAVSQTPYIGLSVDEVSKRYAALALPRRSTKGSAGYDFVSPFSFTLHPGGHVKFPTGIRCKIADGWVLVIAPRSSLRIKYRLQLDNTIGVIDSDYYNSTNEGHIMMSLTNDSGKTLEIKAGDRIAQGIFLPYGITEDDSADGERSGGIGSTGR